MSKEYKLVWLVIAILLGMVQGLSIKVNSKERHCFEVETIQGRDLKIHYQISGEREENVLFELFSLSGQILHTTDMRAEYKYTYKSDNEEPVKICFMCQDRKEKLINFSWRNIVENEFVGIDTIAQSIRSAQAANRKLEKIYMYYQRDYQRLETHTKILKNTVKKIKWGYVFKMILLIVVAVIQIALIIKPFKMLSSQYQTV